jgi:hypothetical protein
MNYGGPTPQDFIGGFSLRRNRRNQFFQGESVPDGKAIGIIIEIDKYHPSSLSPILDSFGPLFQFLI